jgi:Tol biopolymer transport system component
MINADGGKRRQILGMPGDKSFPAVSPDGQFFVFPASYLHVWRVDVDGGNLKQLTFSDSQEGLPHITPDGKWVVFSSFSTGKMTPWKEAAGGGEPIQLSDKQLQCNDVSPDGRLIACADITQQQGKWKIVLLPLAGGEPVKVIEPPDNCFGRPGWTPDGRAVTIACKFNGADNLWVLPLVGGQPTQLTRLKTLSPNSLADHALSPDGKLLAMTLATENTELVLITDFK